MDRWGGQRDTRETVAQRRREAGWGQQFATLYEVATGQTSGLLTESQVPPVRAARIASTPSPLNQAVQASTRGLMSRTSSSLSDALGSVGFSSMSGLGSRMGQFLGQGAAPDLLSMIPRFGAPDPFGGQRFKSAQQMMTEYLEEQQRQRDAQNPPGSSGGGGTATSPWANVNRWGSTLSAASSQYGVPLDILYAIMYLESGGDPNSMSPQGATGLMQIMPFWNGTGGYDIHNPTDNIMLGAYILKSNFDQYGSWDNAIRAYLGFGEDALGTDDMEYLNRINELRKQVQVNGGGGGSTAVTGNISMLWGGGSMKSDTNYWFGEHTDAGYYDYAPAYGLRADQHTGVDFLMPVGTSLYSLVSGTIEDSCTGVGFADYFGQGCGRITIRLDNGDLIIYGHMSTSNVRIGQRVTPGMQIGTSGGMNSPHVHFEVRGNGGTQLVDPLKYFG